MMTSNFHGASSSLAHWRVKWKNYVYDTLYRFILNNPLQMLTFV